MTPVISLPTLRETLTVAFRHKQSICLALILPIVASVGIAFMLTPQYEADSKILIRVGREYIPQTDAPVGGNTVMPSPTMQETIDTEGEILTSNDLLRELLQRVTIRRLYPDLYDSPPSDMSLEDAALKALHSDLGVDPVKLSNVLTISLRNGDRSVAVEALQQLLGMFQIRHVAAFSHHRSALLETQLSDDLARLVAQEKERAQYEKDNNLFSIAEQRTAAIQKREKDMADLQDADLSITGLNYRLDYLKGQLAQQHPNVTLQNTNQDSPVSDDTRKHLRDLREQRQQLLSRYDPNSPMLNSVNAALAAAEQFAGHSQARTNAVQTGINPVYSGLQAQLYTAGSDLAPLLSKVAALRAAITSDDARLAQISTGEAVLDDLNRRITQLDTASNTLRQRVEDARYLEDLDKADVASLNIIQQPTALPRAVFPKKWLFLAAGVVIGLVLSTLVMLLSLTFGNRFLTIDTIERVLGLPVLVALPNLPRARLRAAATLSQSGARRELPSR